MDRSLVRSGRREALQEVLSGRMYLDNLCLVLRSVLDMSKDFFYIVFNSSSIFSRRNAAKRCMPAQWQQTAQPEGRVDQAKPRQTVLARPRDLTKRRRVGLPLMNSLKRFLKAHIHDNVVFFAFKAIAPYSV